MKLLIHSKVHGANMGPTWVLSAQMGPMLAPWTLQSGCFLWDIISIGCNYLSKPKFNGGLIWWRHQMETFSALLAICAGNSPFPGEFPAQRPVTRSFDVSFDLRLNNRLSKQSRGWWFDTLSRPLWRHCNDIRVIHFPYPFSKHMIAPVPVK